MCDCKQKAREEKRGKQCYNCLVKECIRHFKHCTKTDRDIKLGKFLSSVMRDKKLMEVGWTGDAEDLEDNLNDEKKNSMMRDIFHSDQADLYRCKVRGERAAGRIFC